MADSDIVDFIILLNNIPDLNIEAALKNIGGSKVIYERIIKKFVRLIPPNVDNLDKLVYEEQNLVKLALKAHNLKGSLRQMGCDNMAELAEELESISKSGDIPGCIIIYEKLKEKLLLFYNETHKIIEESDGKRKAAIKPPGNLKERLDVFVKAKAALMEYDSILAAELLADAANLDYGSSANNLISKALMALDVFQSQEALGYIESLLKSSE